MFDLGLKLTELLQVKALESLRGGVLVPRCRGSDVRRCCATCPLAWGGTVAYPCILNTSSWHPEPDVEALTSGIVSALIIGVGVTEAVVACGHEATHGFRVAEA